MKNKYELMGQYVEVKAYMEPARQFCARSYMKYDLKTPRVGMVVGYRTVYEGKIQHGKYNSEDFEPNYLTDIKSIKVILVCFWPTYKPVLVLPEDISNASWTSLGVPFSRLYHPTTYPCSDKYKEELRQYAKEMKRDAKGRWTTSNVLQK